MNIQKKLNNWRQYRQTVRELNSLSTRELSDLGISRGDINRVAKEGLH